MFWIAWYAHTRSCRSPAFLDVPLVLSKIQAGTWRFVIKCHRKRAIEAEYGNGIFREQASQAARRLVRASLFLPPWKHKDRLRSWHGSPAPHLNVPAVSLPQIGTYCPALFASPKIRSGLDPKRPCLFARGLKRSHLWLCSRSLFAWHVSVYDQHDCKYDSCAAPYQKKQSGVLVHLKQGSTPKIVLVWFDFCRSNTQVSGAAFEHGRSIEKPDCQPPL